MKKILIVGCGSIGKRHAENASRISQTAVFDVNTQAASATARSLKIPFFQTLEEGLSWRPDGVVIATPNHTHIKIAHYVVAFGADVLIEKPLSYSLNDVGHFLEEAEKKGCRVIVACNMRFHPAIKSVHSHLSKIGRPYFARAHYGNYLPDMRPGVDYRKLYCAHRTMGGGVIFDAIHEIDYLMWFFGQVETVLCKANRLSSLDIDVEDYASINLCFTSGMCAELHLDYLQRAKRRGVEIVGSEGTIIWNSDGKFPEQCSVKLYTPDNGWQVIYAEKALDANEMYLELMQKFILALESSYIELLNGRQAAEELDVVFAAKKSAAEGRLISLKVER